MPLTNDELQHCLYAATTAAYRAGHHVMNYYGREIAIESKGAAHLAGDVVTVADRESQEVILDILADLHPDIGVLSEESDLADPSRFEKPYFWCIDPIDGTLPFLEHVNGFAVSIALVAQDGSPVMGVCYLPAFGDLYHAIAGQGAFKNGRPVSFAPMADGAMVTLSLNHMEAVPPERHAKITSIAAALEAVPGAGKLNYQMHSGAVAKGCQLLEYAPALYVGIPRDGNQGVSVWDLAATACIVQEAGGSVSDIFGAPLELNRKESAYCHHRGYILASHEALARAVIEA